MAYWLHITFSPYIYACKLGNHYIKLVQILLLNISVTKELEIDMEDSNSMINMPSLYDDKVGNKRVRDGQEEIHKGRLEKRPSGILGVSNGGDCVVDGGDEAANDGGGGGGGIIDTFISNVFHNNKSGTNDELVEVGNEDEDKREDLGGDNHVDGGGGGESGGGDGGIITSFFSNIFQNNGNVDDGGYQVKSDHLVDEKIECLGGGGGEPEDVKKDEVVDLPSKDTTGPISKLKPDDYAERVFFLNNN
ncbi:uncharacterized protein LOC143580681 [Bidens hawaiensis]|uniref:uncharacterized protein LOC143580681 n=1 Tax=Bidens hawaiensis TaxID=980011 RepID=UPI004048F682